MAAETLLDIDKGLARALLSYVRARRPDANFILASEAIVNAVNDCADLRISPEGDWAIFDAVDKRLAEQPL